MILPEKHLNSSESLLGLGAFLLSLLDYHNNIDDLWESYTKAYEENKYPVLHGYDNYILCLDFLYIIGAILINNSGEITKCD